MLTFIYGYIRSSCLISSSECVRVKSSVVFMVDMITVARELSLLFKRSQREVAKPAYLHDQRLTITNSK